MLFLHSTPVVQALGYALTAAQLGNAVLATKSFQHNPDLVFPRMVLTRGPADIIHNLFDRLHVRPGFISKIRCTFDYD